MKPLIASTVFGIVMMFVSLMVRDKRATSNWATVLFAALLGVHIWELSGLLQGNVLNLFNGMLTYDSFSIWYATLLSAATLLFVLLSHKAIERVGQHVAEYYALIFFILCGVNLLSGYGNLLTLFLGIEILSIPQYILAGSDKRNLKSSEASLKYFLMGAFSTGILLMGIALLYGASGSFSITQLNFSGAGGINIMALSGIIFIIIALGFKVSAAPMHFWTPDVYDGAPTPFTSFMATIVKVAVFGAFIRLFSIGFGTISDQWQFVLAIVTALTLLIGNITAVFQQSVKRMLAYSSIAQAGFMLFAVLSNNAFGMKSIIIYAVAYSVATIGIFSILIKLKDYTYDGFNGLAKKDPMLAFVGAIFLFSLAGIPLTAGFFAKWYVLTSVLENGNGLLWLVIFALVMAAVSSYYYFRVIIAMYFKQGEAEMVESVTFNDRLWLGVSAAIVIILGVAPDLLLYVLQRV